MSILWIWLWLNPLACAGLAPTCVSKAADASYQEPADLKALMGCQKRKLARSVSDYQAKHGTEPPEETLEGWQELQRGEVRDFIQRHPDRSVIEGDVDSEAGGEPAGPDQGGGGAAAKPGQVVKSAQTKPAQGRASAKVKPGQAARSAQAEPVQGQASAAVKLGQGGKGAQAKSVQGPSSATVKPDQAEESPKAEPGQGQAEQAPPADLEALKKDLLEKSDQGRKGVTPEMAAEIVAALKKQQGSVSPDMAALLDAVQKDGPNLSADTFHKLQDAARKANASGLDLGASPEVEDSLLKGEYDKDQPAPAPPAPGTD
ncbi:MAG: hypothetical protein NTY77_15130 [Elusimicrobia bacterium]|nr:hypothetical protein [Elusimicrobiota bacterium]